MAGEKPVADAARARALALKLLAGRDHSARELKTKLRQKGFDAVIIDPVIEQLTAGKLLSEDRYAESFVRQYSARGQGPVRIRLELRERGVASELIDLSLEQADVDWVGLARSVRQRKFGATEPAGFAERAKQARFLQYRGFTTDHIRAALGNDGGDIDAVVEDATGDTPGPDT